MVPPNCDSKPVDRGATSVVERFQQAEDAAAGLGSDPRMQPLSAIDESRSSIELRRAFAQFPSGVVALCADSVGGPVGMVASSFTSVSLTPTLVSVSIAKSSTTWPKLECMSQVGISVLGGDQTQACAALSSQTSDRFAGVPYYTSPSGSLFIAGSPLTLDCTVSQSVSAGDHQIILLEVLEMSVRSELTPLVFHQSALRAL